MSNLQNILNANATSPLVVPSGGTGIATTTAYGVICGGTTSTGILQNAGTGTSGQILTSAGSAALPTWASLPLEVTWTAASTTPITAVINTGYYITDASQVTVTLPATAAAGSIVAIVGNGAGGWVLQPGAGQTIQIIGATVTTSATSTGQYDCIEVLCTVADTTWVARSLMSIGLSIV